MQFGAIMLFVFLSSSVWNDWADQLHRLQWAVEMKGVSQKGASLRTLVCVCILSCVRWLSKGTAYRTRKLPFAGYTWWWRCEFVSSAVWEDWADRHNVQIQTDAFSWLHLAVEVWGISEKDLCLNDHLYVYVLSCVSWSCRLAAWLYLAVEVWGIRQKDCFLNMLKFMPRSSAVLDGLANQHSVEDQTAALCRLHLAV